MAITDEQLTYTMLAQGISGAPTLLRATMGSVETFTPSPIYQGLPNLTTRVFDSFNFIVDEFDSNTQFINRCQASVVSHIPFFYPSKQVNNINYMELANTGSASARYLNINLIDTNGELIRDHGVSYAESIYEQWSIDLEPSTYHAPLVLFLYGDITTNRCYFAFAAKFSNDMISKYPALANKWYFNDGGALLTMDLIRLMLDESMIADDEGGAPTGDAGGGGGLYDYPYGAISIPNLPQYSVCDTGMVGIYSTTPSQMYQLSNKLWSQNFFDSIIKNFESPIENIISLHAVPFNVYGGSTQNIHIGNYDTEIPSNLLASSYYDIDCGTININGAYKTFADYSPFTHISCYLPYIGVVDIPPDDVQDGAINIRYHIDVFSGACVVFISAFIRGQWTVVQQHQGDIITQYPISGADFTNVFVGRIGAITKAITAGAMFASIPATAGASAPITAASTMGANVGAMATQATTSALTAKPTYQRTGSMASAAGLMGVQTPYLIFTKPNFIQASNFREIKGYTSNLQCVIGEQTGFLSASVKNEKLEGFGGATDREKELIKNTLAAGIYIS